MAPLFRHWRDYEALSEEEVNVGKREEAAARWRQALERVEDLDLRSTGWPGRPPSAVVDAITYSARRALQRPPDPRATALRSELAHRHGVAVERVVVGEGASGLLNGLLSGLLAAGDELICPWPTYSLHPLLARRAGASAVPVAGHEPERLLAALTPRTRVVALCGPVDPTGALLGAADVRALLDALPERVVVVLDEALRDHVDAEAPDAALRLTDDHERLLVLRTFSKAWGLAGLRVGYAVGAPGSEELLERAAPPLGVSELSQAGVLAALRADPGLGARRGAAVAAAREPLRRSLRELGLDVAPSQANVLWCAHRDLPGAELAARLRRSGIVVADGGPLGDPARVRITIPAAEEHGLRLVRAVELAVGPGA